MFNDRLKKSRLLRNMTGREVAQAMNVTPPTYSGWEHGKREPSLDNVAKLCQLLDVSADYLIGISEDPDSKVVRIQSSMPSITARLNRELDPLADLTTIERQLVLDYARKLIAARPRPVEGPEKSEGAC